jgi:hypothetical protein
MAMARRPVPAATVTHVLTEAGYRCAVPTCRGILAIDIHHLVEVAEGGGNETANLLALCPTCHALFHRGTIVRDSIYAWKCMLVSLSSAYDTSTLDDLLFLSSAEVANLRVSGDGVLKFTRLIAGGLATFQLFMQNGPILLYTVSLTQRGQQLVNVWRGGDRAAVAAFLGAA